MSECDFFCGKNQSKNSSKLNQYLFLLCKLCVCELQSARLSFQLVVKFCKILIGSMFLKLYGLQIVRINNLKNFLVYNLSIIVILKNFLAYNLSIIVILVRSHLCFTSIPTKSNFYFISIPTKLDFCFLCTFIKSYFYFNFVPIGSCIIFVNIKSISYFTCTPMKSNSCFAFTKSLFSTPLNKELTTL